VQNHKRKRLKVQCNQFSITQVTLYLTISVYGLPMSDVNTKYLARSDMIFRTRFGIQSGGASLPV